MYRCAMLLLRYLSERKPGQKQGFFSSAKTLEVAALSSLREGTMDENQHTESEPRGSEDKRSVPLSSPQTQRESERLQQNHVEEVIKDLRDRGYKVTEEYDASGQRAKFTKEVPLKKTGWDWLQLLIVPLALLLIGSVFSVLQSQTSLQVSERQYQEGVLQTYIDHMSDYMSDLLSLLKCEQGDRLKCEQEEQWKVAQTVAQEQTLTALQRLDAEHRAIVVRFLLGAGLLNGTEHTDPIINLADSNLEGGITLKGFSTRYAKFPGANLSDADLYQAILDHADLHKANLTGADLYNVFLEGAQLRAADLEQADLSDADLTGADLRDADLSWADLQGAHVTKQQLARAKSLQGAIMPDGSKHP
jgi:Pentapeptide repeats (8 copies)